MQRNSYNDYTTIVYHFRCIGIEGHRCLGSFFELIMVERSASSTIEISEQEIPLSPIVPPISIAETSPGFTPVISRAAISRLAFHACQLTFVAVVRFDMGVYLPGGVRRWKEP